MRVPAPTPDATLCSTVPTSSDCLSGAPSSSSGSSGNLSSGNLSQFVSVYITASPRVRDCTSAIESLLTQLRQLLPLSPTTVVFDGLHPSLLQDVRNSTVLTRRLKLGGGNGTSVRLSYAAKISAIRRHPMMQKTSELPVARVVEHSTWLHKGAALQRAMERCSTPLVFVAEEDVELVDIPNIDTSLMIHLLLCDSERVQYVHLYWGSTLDPVKYGTPTHEAHPEQPALLKVHRWSDRPHFATLALYKRVVWPFFSRNHARYKSAIEAELIARFGHNQTYQKYGSNISTMPTWGMWLYAPRQCMRHEMHHQCGRYARNRNPSYGRRLRQSRETSAHPFVAAVAPVREASCSLTPPLPAPSLSYGHNGDGSSGGRREQGPPQCALLTAPRPRLWWYPAPLPPWDAERNWRFRGLRSLVEHSEHYVKDGACADYFIISNHVAIPLARRQNNSKVLSMFWHLSRTWPYWNQTAGRGLRRHLVLSPCDVGPAQCLYEHPLGRDRARRRQHNRRHAGSSSSSRSGTVAAGSSSLDAPAEPALLPDAIEPMSDMRKVGFLTPNGAPGPFNYFVAGLDVRLPQDEEHECGIFCGVPLIRRWQHGLNILRRFSPWSLRNPELRDAVLRRTRPIRFFWSGASAGVTSQRGLLLYHHLNRSGFLLRDTSLSGRASGRASAVGVEAIARLSTFAAKPPSEGSRTSGTSGAGESHGLDWFARMMSSSDFCYSPLGQLDGDSDRYLPAILYGCVPIFVSNSHKQRETGPFAEVINWNEVALHVTRKEIPALHTRLEAVGSDQVLAMRRAMAAVWPRLLWSRVKPRFPRQRLDQYWPFLSETPEQPDAFATLIEQLRRRLEREGRDDDCDDRSREVGAQKDL